MNKLTSLKTCLVKFAAGLAIFTPLFFAVSALGSRFGLWDWKFGFGVLVRNYGTKLLLLTLIVAVLALILSLVLKPRKGWMVALLALVVPLVGMGYGKSVADKAKALPFIHDVTTDTQDVPTFTNAIISLRGAGSNSLDYVGKIDQRSKKLVSVEQVAAYPDIRTIVLSETSDIVFERALKAAKSMGWNIASSAQGSGIQDAGMIEATATSFWFGFKDDVVIRVRPSDGGGSIVDVRSISRVGGSDLGANAARVRKFRD
ncbi:MAG: DUF1499 domain-containing protein, partial [Robiginitomaculum sp.]|nr:DUF1499 domain-containing protein [Robiginitomaculum sp.]